MSGIQGRILDWTFKADTCQIISSVQFSSVAQSCLTLCDPMNRSTPGLPVHHKPQTIGGIKSHKMFGDKIIKGVSADRTGKRSKD